MLTRSHPNMPGLHNLSPLLGGRAADPLAERIHLQKQQCFG